jgi:hypothetical protein
MSGTLNSDGSDTPIACFLECRSQLFLKSRPPLLELASRRHAQQGLGFCIDSIDSFISPEDNKADIARAQ